jgi:release factor glutamine methyltransferase
MATNNIGGQTVGDTLAGLTSRLETNSETAALDAQVLLAHLLSKPRSWVLAHPEFSLSATAFARLRAMTHRLEAGEPFPYILGSWEFFGLQFDVTSDVLIPRPETELLVERAIAWLKDQESGVRGENVLDMGTGSGCIAISLAVNVPGLSIIATDISSAALKVAHGNAEKMKVSGSINFLGSDLFSNPSLEIPFSMIVTNPPYIPTRTMRQAAIFGREPTIALDGGTDGLALIRRILSASSDHLLAGGLLLMEIEASEGQAVLALASEAFPKARIQLHQDLAGHDRLLEVQK